MAENLMCPAQRTSNDAYREGWDRVFRKKLDCKECLNYYLPEWTERYCPSCIRYSNFASFDAP